MIKILVHLMDGRTVTILLDEDAGASASRTDTTMSYDQGEGMPAWTFPWSSVAYIETIPQ